MEWIYGFSILAMLIFPSAAEAQGLVLQGMGVFVAPGKGGHAENLHMGLTGTFLFNKRDIESGPAAGVDFEGGYFSTYRGFPNGSTVFSAGMLLDPVKKQRSKAWPRFTGGVTMAPVLREGFRTGYYVGGGVMGWKQDRGSTVTWGGIEFRDYLFRIGGRYERYYQLRFSIIGRD